MAGLALSIPMFPNRLGGTMEAVGTLGTLHRYPYNRTVEWDPCRGAIDKVSRCGRTRQVGSLLL